jgi:hypothetical protein
MTWRGRAGGKRPAQGKGWEGAGGRERSQRWTPGTRGARGVVRLCARGIGARIPIKAALGSVLSRLKGAWGYARRARAARYEEEDAGDVGLRTCASPGGGGGASLGSTLSRHYPHAPSPPRARPTRLLGYHCLVLAGKNGRRGGCGERERGGGGQRRRRHRHRPGFGFSSSRRESRFAQPSPGLPPRSLSLDSSFNARTRCV